MIRIDDEEENRGVRRQFFPFENIIVGRDARRPAEPSVHLFSTERGPSAGAVRARITAKPMNSVFEREPWTGKSGKRGPGAGAVRARLPAKPMNSVFEREPGDTQNSKTRPTRRRSPPARQRLIGTAGRPIHFGGAPGGHCPEVKFKLTIQSENLRLNSRYFYHSKACLKW